MGFEQTRQQAAAASEKFSISCSLEGVHTVIVARWQLRRAMIQQKSGLHEVEIKAVLIKFIDFP